MNEEHSEVLQERHSGRQEEPQEQPAGGELGARLAELSRQITAHLEGLRKK